MRCVCHFFIIRKATKAGVYQAFGDLVRATGLEPAHHWHKNLMVTLPWWRNDSNPNNFRRVYVIRFHLKLL